MVNSSKKLPCGHIFHTACLRSWFQRQQTCPTCRLNILRTAHQPAHQNAGGVQPVPPNNAVNPNPNIAAGPADEINVNRNGDVGGGLPHIPNLQNFMGNMFTTPMMPPNLDNLGSGDSAVPMMPPVGPMSFPSIACMSPYAIPPPPMPPALDTLTEAELHALEGTERHHVEERIKLLRNIQLMLDASVALMNQYNMIVSNLPTVIPIPGAPVPSPPTPPATTSSSIKDDDAQPSTSKGADATPIPFVAAPVAPTPQIDGAAQMKLNTPPTVKEVVKIEDVGSEDHLETPPVVPVSKISESNSVLTTTTKSPSNTLIDTTIDNTPPETAELRRRRLQKFLQNESALD